MKVDDFVSAPDDLIPAALAHGQALEDEGWKVTIEPYDLAYPRTPFFTAKRRFETRIVEIQSKLDLPLLREWARYCKTCDKDTRIIVGLTEGTTPTIEEMEAVHEYGVGVYVLGASGRREWSPAKDLAVAIELPDLPPRLRPILGEAYDHFNRGQWRDGFEGACTALEQESKYYLRSHVSRGRIRSFISVRTGRPKTYTAERIDRMTMGALAIAFSEIQTPNAADSRIGQALAQLNDDRITAAHFKGIRAARERKLRKNVARHMFIIVGALRHLKNINP